LLSHYLLKYRTRPGSDTRSKHQLSISLSLRHQYQFNSTGTSPIEHNAILLEAQEGKRGSRRTQERGSSPGGTEAQGPVQACSHSRWNRRIGSYPIFYGQQRTEGEDCGCTQEQVSLVCQRTRLQVGHFLIPWPGWWKLFAITTSVNHLDTQPQPQRKPRQEDEQRPLHLHNDAVTPRDAFAWTPACAQRLFQPCIGCPCCAPASTAAPTKDSEDCQQPLICRKEEESAVSHVYN
jgi:hypothetical protein